MNRIKASLVDVFAQGKFTGNGLTIFENCAELSSEKMLLLTQEMRQYESIFLLSKPENGRLKARIFAMEGELDFAGHPLLGLGAYLHENWGDKDVHSWTVELNCKDVCLRTCRQNGFYSVEMDQEKPQWLKTLKSMETAEILPYFNLKEEDMSSIPCQVVTTGLPYLIIPIVKGLERVWIKSDIEDVLARHSASYAYILNVDSLEGRSWDNKGQVEDIATGSAAGPAAALLFKEGKVAAEQSFSINQGQWRGRPSKINVEIHADGADISNIVVSGDVYKIADILF